MTMTTRQEIDDIKQQRDEIKSRAVAMLDLLEDIHQQEIMDDGLRERATAMLNDSHWVDQ